MKEEGRGSEVPGENDSCSQGARSGADPAAPFLLPELPTKVSVESWSCPFCHRCASGCFGLLLFSSDALFGPLERPRASKFDQPSSSLRVAPPPEGGCFPQDSIGRDLAPAERGGSLMKECLCSLRSGGQVLRWKAACCFRACRVLDERTGLLLEFCLQRDDIRSFWIRFALLDPSVDSSSPLRNYRKNSKKT
jgi:hypothetical protein